MASVAVPLTLVGVATLWVQYRTERTRAEMQLVEQARAVAQLVDREFQRMETAVRVLASSSALARNDLAAFANELLATRSLLSAGLPAGTEPVRIRVLDAEGRLRLDTYVLDGGVAFQRGLPHAQTAIATGRTQISDLQIGPITGRPYVVIAVPVFAPAPAGPEASRPSGAIGANIPRERLLTIVNEAGLPLGADASVLDRKGIIAARSFRDAETVGKPPLPDVLAAVLRDKVGLAPSGLMTLDGVQSVIAYAHAPFSGYIAMLAVPEDVFLAPLWSSLLQTAGIGALVLVVGLGTATVMARRIVSAFQRVPMVAAEAVEAGGVLGRRTGLREADQLAGTIASAEMKRRASDAEFALLADAMPGWVFISDAAGHNLYVNRTYLQQAGVTETEVMGQGWLALLHEQDRPRIPIAWREAARAGTDYVVEYRARVRDGSYRWFLSRGRPLRDGSGQIFRWFGVAVDIEDRHTAEEALRDTEARLRALTQELEARVQTEVAAREAAQVRAAHAERMQALGQLAGGLAHDFNNILQGVQGGAAIINRRAHDVDAVRRFAGIILDAAVRGASVTRRLLAFARRGDLRSEPLNAKDLLEGMREVLGSALGSIVDLHIEAPVSLPLMLADKAQLETVLVNLATNARDAMPDGGTLTFAAASDVVEEQCIHPTDLRPGGYVRLTVSDTGVGMDQATLVRAMEPFFTTKSQGKGTGLGLSMAKGFLEQSGGGLTLHSILGRGTTVSLWLPEAPAADAGAEVNDVMGLPERRADRHILLVDDEAMVRETMAESLEEIGYSVLVAEDGASALGILDEGETVDVLVTDLTMPGMSGLILIREAQKRRPALPSVLVTGYAGDGAQLAVSGALTGAFSLLRKPVTAGQVADRIEALLEPVANNDPLQPNHV
ncbi:MAG: response regulator [Acetobacteraceae bacterium]